jgi:hypothetical protein
MRAVVSVLPFLLATNVAAQALPACADAALAAAPDEWDRGSVLSGDLTLDGQPDVAFWKGEEASILLFVAACDGERAVETWRFRIPVPTGEAAGARPVQLVGPLLDQVLVDRVCASGRADECEHMREENRRRQSTADAGGRELHIGRWASGGVRLRWSREHRGFMRIGG